MSLRGRWIVASCLLLSACMGAYARLAHRDRIIIPHAKHAAAKVDCLTCHETVYDSKKLGDPVMPNEKTCMQCHKDKQQQCSMCHTDIKARTELKQLVSHAKPGSLPVEPQPIIMNHSAHIERVKEDCKVCHTTLPNPLRDAANVPTMDSCLTCHQKSYDQGTCRQCHTDLKEFPLKPITSYTHSGNFVKEHKRAARSDSAPCADCHDQSFCADCHASTVATRIDILLPERVERDFVHRNDFLSHHATEARLDAGSCAKCHGQSFCSSCHTAQGLTPVASNPRSPHPAGYALPGSGQSHAADARHDINACASCHDQGAKSICVDCHRSGGVGGNPHPSGWSRRHPQSEIGTNHMCLACHQ